MDNLLKLGTLVFLGLFLSSSIGAQNKMDAETLECLVKLYHERQIKIFQKGSKVEDIENIFELFSDDFTYVHPKYGGVYTRKVLHDGYLRNHKRGGYNGRVKDIRINKMITGLNAVVIESQEVLRDLKIGKIESGDKHMTLFEFKDGKISRIYEYW